MSARALPLVTALLGVLTLGAFLALGSQPAVRAVYSASEISTNVSVFQRAETLGDIAAVFGAPADPAKMSAMDALNTLDLYAFIPAYALFLVAAAILLGGLRNRSTQIAIVFALLGAVGDAIETWKQLQLTADIANAETHLPIAPWHWLKYGALALNGVAVATICVTSAKKRWALGAIAFVSFPIVVLSYMDAITPRAFAATFALYWIALLVVAAMEAIKPSASATSSQP
ncbi:hypothetical protein [Terricaulis silvestris]|uniref:DUF4386 family protein n=1 Tax=Terricaulis silvestris TaxID=2686094 RepID=A0A6I6MGU9_9CAUL|nr:hypothetical protein [Terricaulis silvestris]QGZ93930.1 hypothetical protein DSM104635_00745 [Terricaulis silvestris]